MDRFPLARQLNHLSPTDRLRVLDKWAADLTQERKRLLSDTVTPSDRATHRDLLRSNRRRLKRLRELAAMFEVEIEHHFADDQTVDTLRGTEATPLA